MAQRWQTIEKCSNSMEAGAIKSFLEGHGIPCVILGFHTVQTHPFFHDPIELQVPLNRLEEAKALIEACRKENLSSNEE